MNLDVKNIPVINRRDDTNERESQVRLSLSFDEAFAYEKDTPLGEVYRFWRDACEFPDDMPFASLLEKRDRLSPEAQACAHTVVDVSSDDPFHFLIKEQTLRTPFGSNMGLRLFELPSQIVRDAVLCEYMRAKENARPMMTEVHQWRHQPDQAQRNICRHYLKIDLPMVDPNTGRVSYLLIVSRLIDETIVGLPRRLVNSELVG